MQQTFHRSHRGVALVIVLSMIVLITALVVSFTMNMRTERQVSHTMSENERVKLVANTALAHAVGILDANIPQPVPPIPSGSPTPAPVNWAVNPGMLNIIQGTLPGVTVTQVPLSTNPKSDYVSTTQDANINQLQSTTNQYPVTGTSDPMYVAWANVLQNPAAAASATNPIAARYAFWIDDENAKINVNTAYGKLPMNYFDPRSGVPNLTPGTITETASPAVGANAMVPLGHPGGVNLDMLGTSFDKAGLLSFLKTYGATKSPETVKAFFPGTDSAKEALFQANKFSLTATSRDPEFNVFGKSRLFMYAGPTGQLDTALGGGMFQRFRDLDAPMYFHGNENSSTAAKDQTAMYYTAANLSSIFARRDWPGMPAVSFVDKWDKDANGSAYPGANPGDIGKREADQVAWNTVVMGSLSDFLTYSLASPGAYASFSNFIPAPSPDPPNSKTGSNGSVNYPNAALPVGSLSGKAIVPAAPKPMVDEICLNIVPESTPTSSGYYLKFGMSYGVWLPPGYPAADFSQTACDFFVGMTHLEYTVTGGGKSATQKNTSYGNNQPDNYYEGIKTGKVWDHTDSMQPGDRVALLSLINKPLEETSVLWYARNGMNGFAQNPNGSVSFPLTAVVNVDMKMRFYVRNRTPKAPDGTYAYKSLPSQVIPVWDGHDPGAVTADYHFGPPTDVGASTGSRAAAAFSPPADDPYDYVHFNFNLDLAALGTTQSTRTLRVADPRTGGLARSWKPSWQDAMGHDLPNASTTPDFNSLGDNYNAETAGAIAAGWQLDKFAYIDMSAGTALPHSSVGMFSLVPTGMQRGIPGQNFKLQPNPNPTTQLPDWLLLDLFSPTVSPPNGSTAWADIVRMNATAGKINVNAGIYPNTGKFSPPARVLPLQALFKNTPAASSVAQNVLSHNLAPTGHYYPGAGAFYNYPGEICEIQDVINPRNTDWEKEATIRYLASTITTKSNTFSVWGVAQTLKKLATNHQYGTYETGDLITGEKRFQAIVERYVWPGADAAAGNARVNANGTYDQLSKNATQPGAAPTSVYAWENLDGPDAPTYPVSAATDNKNATQDAASDPYNASALSTYSSGLIENANNPVRAVMKYRVIYFKYLD